MNAFCAACAHVGVYPIPSLPPCPACGGMMVIRYPRPTPAAPVLRSRKGRRLPVLNPGGQLAYLAGIDEVNRLILTGEAHGFGPGSRLDGCVLIEASSHIPGGQNYVERIVVEWPSPLGPQQSKIYQFKKITGLDPLLFSATQLDCGAQARPRNSRNCISKPKGKHVRRKKQQHSRTGDRMVAHRPPDALWQKSA